MNVLSPFQKLQKTKDKVIYLLERRPDLRDDDQRLVVVFNWYEIGSTKFDLMSAKDFCDMLLNGKITPAQTILRARRKAQEQRPDLRGAAYLKRHSAANEVRENASDM